MNSYTKFSSTLLTWHRGASHREMPWRGERDPYLVWLSEIILQQTRVEQGLPYFLRFKEKYPTVKKLAAASEDDVMRLWQGLGYYSRARHLHATAKHITDELGGKFPTTYEQIRALKGVGPYTAAAIASFVFGERQAVVDGNVIRVLSRIYGIEQPFDTTEGKKVFASLAEKLISPDHPGEYNQAIMDLGAQVCMPVNPQCDECPFSNDCTANKNNLQRELPVRSKRITKKVRFFYYLLIKNSKEIIISRRSADDIWKGLYELPMIESPKAIRTNLKKTIRSFVGTDCEVLNYSKPYIQQLTHQTIHSVFIAVDGIDIQHSSVQGAICVPIKKLSAYGFPKVVHLFLSENSLL